jgi:hypothetical protein
MICKTATKYLRIPFKSNVFIIRTVISPYRCTYAMRRFSHRPFGLPDSGSNMRSRPISGGRPNGQVASLLLPHILGRRSNTTTCDRSLFPNLFFSIHSFFIPFTLLPPFTSTAVASTRKHLSAALLVVLFLSAPGRLSHPRRPFRSASSAFARLASPQQHHHQPHLSSRALQTPRLYGNTTTSFDSLHSFRRSPFSLRDF